MLSATIKSANYDENEEALSGYFSPELELFIMKTANIIAGKLNQPKNKRKIQVVIDEEDIAQDLRLMCWKYRCVNETELERLLIEKGLMGENITEKYTTKYELVNDYEHEKEENTYTTNDTAETLLINNIEKTETETTEEIKEIKEAERLRIASEKLTSRQREVWNILLHSFELAEAGIIKKPTQQECADLITQKTSKPIARQSLVLLLKRISITLGIDILNTKLAKKRKTTKNKRNNNVIPMPNVKECAKLCTGIYIPENCGRNKTAKIYEYINYIKPFNTVSIVNELNTTDQLTSTEKAKTNVFAVSAGEKNIGNIGYKIQNNSFANSKNKRKTNIFKIKYSRVTSKTNIATVTDTVTNNSTVIDFTSFTDKAFNAHKHTHKHLASMQSYKYQSIKARLA